MQTHKLHELCKKRIFSCRHKKVIFISTKQQKKRRIKRRNIQKMQSAHSMKQ